MVPQFFQVGVVVRDIAVGTVGLGLDSLAGWIIRSVANGSPLQRFLRDCVVQALSRGVGPRTHSTLRRNTSSRMEIGLFLFCFRFFAPLYEHLDYLSRKKIGMKMLLNALDNNTTIPSAKEVLKITLTLSSVA